MAPPPEYDKEPKAPDKSATNVSCEETKTLHNLVNDQQTNSDNKSSSTAASVDVENNKLVETLDDGQLRALLDEAITYKCPKDREGKSSLFKELLEEVEQDEQASEAAARGISGGRSVNRACAVTSGRGSRSRRALPHSNSLQDLVAALAAEPAPRRHHRAPPAPAPAPVSTRAIHGGSLPSGVDTSFLLSEEPARGAGYLATVRCVNPPPLAERRVSTDASCGELDSLNRRSKPAFPMTYTARATLEIGSGAVSSGRAVTTTTASNQVRTMPPVTARHPHRLPPLTYRRTAPTAGPPERFYPQKRLYFPTRYKKRKKFMLSGRDYDNCEFNEIKEVDNDRNNIITTSFNTEVDKVIDYNDCKDGQINATNSGINFIREDNEELSIVEDDDTNSEHIIEDNVDPKQFKLLSALFLKMSCDKAENNGGGSKTRTKQCDTINKSNDRKNVPRGPQPKVPTKCQQDPGIKLLKALNKEASITNIETKLQNKSTLPATKAIKTAKKEKKSVKVPMKEASAAKNKYEKIATATSSKSTLSGNNEGKDDFYNPAAEELNKTSNSNIWSNNLNNWYEGLENYSLNSYYYEEEPDFFHQAWYKNPKFTKQFERTEAQSGQNCEQENKNINRQTETYPSHAPSNILHQNIASGEDIYGWSKLYPSAATLNFPLKSASHMKNKAKSTNRDNAANQKRRGNNNVPSFAYTQNFQDYENMRWVGNPIEPVDTTDSDSPRDNYTYNYLDRSRREYRERIGKYLIAPKLDDIINPRNVRSMTIGKPLSSFDEFDYTNESVFDSKDNKQYDEKQLSEETNPPHVDEDQDMLASSNDTNKIQEDYEELNDNEDIPVNLSVRSSTPIPEQNKSLEIDSDVIVAEKENEVASLESSSKTQCTSLIGNSKRKKGTVIPLVIQPDHVSIDNNEHLCSSSQEKDPSSEKKIVYLPPQQARNTYTEFINVNPIKHNKTFNQDQDVELVDISSRTYEMKDLFRDNVKDSMKFDNSLDGCEDIPVSKYFAERQKLRESDASFDNDVELADMSSNCHQTKDPNLEVDRKITILDDCSNKREDKSFSKYLEGQQKLFQVLEDSNLVDSAQVHSLVSNFSSFKSSEKVHTSDKDTLFECINENVEQEMLEESQEVMPNLALNITNLAANFKVLVVTKNLQGQVVLTLPEVFSNDCSIEKPIPQAIEYNSKEKTNKALSYLLNQQQNDNNKLKIEKSKLKKTKSSILEKTKLETANKKALKAIMFENLSQGTRHDKSMSTSSSVSIKEVDSAIPFSCITTPEVVASCNTTSSTSQSAVAVDPKPLQLASSYRAVASLVGEDAAAAPRAASPPPPPRAAPLLAPLAAAASQPRGVISSSFNGLPLSRPNYGSTGNTSQDEYKKSIDENGNSVQGFSSPLSGSSQHKKPRRKKSSKNETVIKSHQIDGYQGNKDLNEVLRFIESAADTSRAGKLGRAKHRDDTDDKGGKKRSGTRKDKESKIKRATSMEELSLSRMEDLTDKPSPPARAPRHSDQAKAERRSWGDDARDAATRFFREEPIDLPVVPDTEFQTVTKKRKPRRRPDEPPEPAAGDPPRARPPEPRARRVSAPPSDRSNDSNDDMDSVHSLPADAVAGRATAPAPISYADIARTRHNIPDLIESCNFYSEQERERNERDRGLPASEAPLAPLPTPGDVDGYPALEPRGRRTTPAQTKPQHTPVPRRDRKVERTESVRNNGNTVTTHAVEEWPAPDVVADRRPAVILLDSAAHPRDMDGVTFGFDINETLLGGPTRRPRCDLVRDAIEGATLPETNGELPPAPAPALPPLAGGVVGAGGVAVGACGSLRYMAPAPPVDTLHLHQIIDYVGAAWEDVVRCGAGKVRYYSE